MNDTDGYLNDIFAPSGRLRTELLHEGTRCVLRESLRFARLTCWDSVRTPHLFMGLLAAPDTGIHAWCDRLGTELPRLLEQFRELFHKEDGDPDAVLLLHREFLSDNVIRTLREAHNRCSDYRRPAVTPMDLLVTLFTTPNSIVAECFERVGFTAAKLTELAVVAEQQSDRA